MKFKYLKITGEMVWGVNEITREALGRLKDGGYDAIINIEEGTMFDADNNEWKEIPGDE